MKRVEDQYSNALIEWCKHKKIDIAHIPNEGKRSVIEGARLKRMGLRRGFPDFFIPIVTKRFAGLFIELKAHKKSPITSHQKFWNKRLNELGYCAVFSFGLDDAIKTIEEYLSLNKKEQ